MTEAQLTQYQRGQALVQPWLRKYPMTKRGVHITCGIDNVHINYYGGMDKDKLLFRLRTHNPMYLELRLIVLKLHLFGFTISGWPE